MSAKFKIKFHPNANKKLVRYARDVRRELGTWEIIREIARRLEVNHRYVRDNLIDGKEPPDTKPEGRSVRVKLFMKEYKPKPKRERPPDLRPEWLKSRMKKIRALAKDTADAVVRHKEVDRHYPAVMPRKPSRMKKLLGG